MEEKNVDKILEELTTVDNKPAVDITPAEVDLPKPKRSVLTIVFAIIVGAIIGVILGFAVPLLAEYATAPQDDRFGEALGAIIIGVYIWVGCGVGFALNIPGLIVSAIRLKKGKGLKSELVLFIIYAVLLIVIALVYWLVLKVC